MMLAKFVLITGILSLFWSSTPVSSSPLSGKFEINVSRIQSKIEVKKDLYFKNIWTIKGVPEKSSFKLPNGLRISLSSPQDKLEEVLPQTFFIQDSGDGQVSGTIEGQLVSPVDELNTDNIKVFSQFSEFFPYNKISLHYEIELKSEFSFSFIPSRVSQSCGSSCQIFIEDRPQQEFYLVLSHQKKYETHLNGVNYGVALIDDDESLAKSYLDLLPVYVNRYEKLFGPYPYSGFWVVENPNETGYAMPGFTMLGSTVIRLPFLLKSSLPHEILHNWFGNSIFVDYNQGNWCEGLTTYFADHYEQKLIGQDAVYRRNSILSYMAYVNGNMDFPLEQFKGRHNDSSQAIGYGKSMMLFKMIENALDEEQFVGRFQELYRQSQFKSLGFADLLKGIFKTEDAFKWWQPWLKEKGIIKISANLDCDSKTLEIQSEPKQLNYYLPITMVTDQGESKTQNLKVENGLALFQLNSQFQNISIDKDFEVFRELTPGEIPVTLSHVLGHQLIYVIVDPQDQNDFSAFFNGFAKGRSLQYQIIDYDQIKSLPFGSAILFFSKENPIDDTLIESNKRNSIELSSSELVYKNQKYSHSNFGWVLSGFNFKNQNRFYWVKPQPQYDLLRWGQQLSHYGSFGFLVFDGKRNIIKESFPSGESALYFSTQDCKK